MSLGGSVTAAIFSTASSSTRPSGHSPVSTRSASRARMGVGPAPHRASRAREAERVLTGEWPEGRVLDDAVEKMAAVTDPPSDIHASATFRKKLVRHVGRQAIELAASRAGGAS